MFDFGTFDYLTFDEGTTVEQAGHGSGTDFVFPAQRKPNEPEKRRSSSSQLPPSASPGQIAPEPSADALIQAQLAATEAINRAQASARAAAEYDMNLSAIILLASMDKS